MYTLKGTEKIHTERFSKFPSNIYSLWVSHTKIRPDRFNRFDDYWLRTNKQKTDRQAKYIYLYLSRGKIGFFSFPCFRTNLNDLESRNETRPGNAEGSFMFSKGWNSEDDMFATLSSPKMESATQTCISFKYSILVKH